MAAIKQEPLIFTHHKSAGTHILIQTRICSHAVDLVLLCLWQCVNRGRYVTPEQSVGNDAVQSLITGSRENRVHSWQNRPGPGTKIRGLMKAKQSWTCEIYWHIYKSSPRRTLPPIIISESQSSAVSLARRNLERGYLWSG